MKSKIMKLRDLKELVNALPENTLDYIVLVEGCDCTGAAADLEIDSEREIVELRRHPDYIGGGYPANGE